MTTLLRYAAVLGPLLAGLALAGCGSSKHEATPPDGRSLSASTRLPDLDHPERTTTLFSRFNANAGVPRLVLLVSPT